MALFRTRYRRRRRLKTAVMSVRHCLQANHNAETPPPTASGVRGKLRGHPRKAYPRLTDRTTTVHGEVWLSSLNLLVAVQNLKIERINPSSVCDQRVPERSVHCRAAFACPTPPGTWDASHILMPTSGVDARCVFWCVEPLRSARWFDWAGERFRPTRW